MAKRKLKKGELQPPRQKEKRGRPPKQKPPKPIDWGEDDEEDISPETMKYSVDDEDTDEDIENEDSDDNDDDDDSSDTNDNEEDSEDKESPAITNKELANALESIFRMVYTINKQLYVLSKGMNYLASNHQQMARVMTQDIKKGGDVEIYKQVIHDKTIEDMNVSIEESAQADDKNKESEKE